MSDTTPADQRKRRLQPWQKLLLAAALPVSLLLMWLLEYFLGHLLFPQFASSPLAVFVSVLLWVVLLVVCGLTSVLAYNFLAREAFDDYRAATKAEWASALQDLHTATEELQNGLRRLGDERTAFEVTRAKIMRDLDEQERQIYTLLKTWHNWLYDNEEILEVEEQTDSEILVMAPDFYYEDQPRYEDVIVKNLLKPTTPTYEYFVPKSRENEGALHKLKKRLEQRLASEPGINAEDVVKKRFKVHLIPDDEFPYCVAYGLAIYRFKDSTKDRCLIYWPKEIGSWNLDILAAGKEDGEKRVNAITSHLQGMSRHYPAT
jgi:hypothetical protein